MIEVTDLVKRYGPTLALDHLSFTVLPGTVTGFLGPNGAGKSTTLRVLLGLDRPQAGRATIGGRPYGSLHAPLHQVGALLDARALAPSRSARAHLLALARSNGIGPRRVEAVLEQCGIADVADRRAGGFSLGMGQRLGIAAALLGDPPVLVLDEPVNGLDPDGIIWIRRLLRSLALEGRTVLLSSHLMSEMAMTADDLVVVGRGRLVAQTTVAAVIDEAEGSGVLARTPEPDRLVAVLGARGLEAHREAGGAVHVRADRTDDIGALAGQHGITLLELTRRQVSLEDAYLQLTRGVTAYRGTVPGFEPPGRPEPADPTIGTEP